MCVWELASASSMYEKQQYNTGLYTIFDQIAQYIPAGTFLNFLKSVRFQLEYTCSQQVAVSF